MRSAMSTRCLTVVSEGFRRSLAGGRRFKATKVAIPLADEIDRYAQYQPTTLSLQSFVDIASGTSNGSANKSFVFLTKELPVRLANIMKEIRLLPEQLLTTPSVKQVEGWYEQSFEDILKYQHSNPDSEETLRRFNETLDIISNRHSSVVETMATGVMEMKEELQTSGLIIGDRIPLHIDNCIQYFLDRFYMSRISIRMIIHQHLIHFSRMDRNRRHIESIDLECDIQSVVEDAYENARFLCEQYYAVAPDCDIECRDPYETKRTESNRIKMTYVPSHLHHMAFELMKNALRAVVEHHHGRDEMPKVKVLICKGRKDLTIKLSDQGGGIRRSELDLLFNYMYSTAPRPPSPDAADSTPLAGYGYGLPLSRLYAKYFNGNLWLNSVDGYGTDAMICLKLLPRDASELLPIYNKTCLNKYLQSAQVGDWSDNARSFGPRNGNRSRL
jgi:pyruvate dehydrogenase kinase 2/3/4